jgi:hypothetical protein
MYPYTYESAAKSAENPVFYPLFSFILPFLRAGRISASMENGVRQRPAFLEKQY